MAFSGAGVGTLVSPYEITTLTQLNEIRNDLSAYYILMNNIDATDTINWNSGAGWIPLGLNYSHEFRGYINGDGHKITNLYINRSVEKSGFIGWLFGEVHNLGIENANVTVSGANFVGIMAGYVGGNAGVSGGILTKLVENCWVSGTVNVDGNNVGGFYGYASGGTTKDCYAIVDINYTGTDSNIGAFAGTNGTSTNCYSVSNLNFNGAGWAGTSGCYYDSDVAGTTVVRKATPKTTIQMKTQATFTAYDFTDIWGIESSNNNGYPYLQIFGEEEPVVTDISIQALIMNSSADISNPFMLVTPNVTIQANEGFIRVVW